MGFPIFLQHDQMDCGPSCIKMIAKYYGKTYTLETLREKCQINREGVSLLSISNAAESIGFHSIGARVNFDTIKKDIPLPLIVHWNQNHFVIVHKIKKNKVLVADPAEGLVEYETEDFINQWASTVNNNTKEGIVLILQPEEKFFDSDSEEEKEYDLRIILNYIFKYKRLLFQLIIGLIAGSLLALVFPFLTKSIVDIGIGNQNYNFINLILVAQLMLFFSKTMVDTIRSWILLHISARVNISIITDFFVKLMKLPVSFFEAKMTGDIMQRIEDHKRIESLLTGSSLNILFSLVSVVVFGYVLATFSIKIFLVFLVGSIIYIFWLLLFLKKRRNLDYKHFKLESKNQNITLQLIQGVNEIKLNNSEKEKRWEWEYVQAKMFKWNVLNMKLEQFQTIGAFFINEGKNITITYLAAVSVLNGNISLGAMLAIQYIIGQMNSPIEQLLILFKNFQDAQLSIRRMNEIHAMKDEEIPEVHVLSKLPDDKTIQMKDISFAYPGEGDAYVLNSISLNIPQGKTTAIVGASGSGKTTLLKILVKFYEVNSGEISIGDKDWKSLNPKFWREHCGVVMQDGFIFSDTIANNIAMGFEAPNMEKLVEAVRMANIADFIDKLPLGFNTKIGSEGHGLSQGQKQRMLIARAIYKDPSFVFFDEATNALDAENEKMIINNLNQFFTGRTVIVVAHRLSTVKNADQIIVLNHGDITETGNHAELIEKKGAYYNLIKNQLELGN